MRGQIGGLAQAQRNAQDGISLVQTAEGALGEVHSMLQRVRDLAVQYKNGTLSTDDQTAVGAEVIQLATEIKSIAGDTEFNGKPLFTTTGFTFQVGANDGETVTTTAANFAPNLAGGGLSEITDIDTAAEATAFLAAGTALASVDAGIKNVSKVRSDFGAVQNRLEHRLNNLATYQENLTASESRIRDVDMAAEMTNFTKLNILQQAGTSMLAQANQAPQGVLSLLRQ
jgi:flagellin